MATRIAYETEICGRCLGSGQYSYCQMYGTRCFKCGGTGKQLTKAARKAREAITEFKTRYHKKAADLVPGQVVLINHKWQTVESIGPNGSKWKDNVTGEWHEYLCIKTGNLGLCTFPESTIEVRYTPEQFRAELLPFAKTLKGVVIT